jgi:hypothetical protein
VILRRRGRFAELVRRQLDVFAVDEAEVLAEVDAAERAWRRAPREDAEEAYGDLQLVLDTIGERLLDAREAYAVTLPDDAVDDYRVAFARAASRRFGRAASLLGEPE